VLTITAANLVRLVQAIQQWQFLTELLSVSPLYLAASGFIWTTAGLVLAWGLWRGRRWAPGLMRLFALAYSLYYWLDRLLLRTAGPGSNWPFTAVANLVLLIFIFRVLSRPRVKKYFGTEPEIPREASGEVSSYREET
jgi:hypothetical protein